MHVTQNDLSGFRADGQALPRDLKIAIDYMRENISQQIRIVDLLVATRVPERTLRRHFLRFFGLAPLTFFRRLRLAAARDALLAKSGDKVTDIASRFGFCISDVSRPTISAASGSCLRRPVAEKCFSTNPATRRRHEPSGAIPLGHHADAVHRAVPDARGPGKQLFG